MREIALDTETTGLDPSDGHRVVEIGCVEMISQVRTGRHFHRYINPDRDMPEEAYKVHGLSSEFLQDKPRFREVVKDFQAFIGDAKLVIHNAAFDMKFLNYELKKTAHAPIPMSRAIDTVEMARKKFPGSPASLDALCKRFGIDLSSRTLHGALLDAELLADVYLELMGGRQSALLLDNNENGNTQRTYEQVDYTLLLGDNRSFTPTPEELATHHAFLNQISEPIWEKYGK